MKIGFLVFVALMGLAISLPRVVEAFSGEVFEIQGSGKISHFHVTTPGTKPFVNSVNAAAVVACIQGTAPGCSVTIESDPVGKAYVYLISDSEWRIATQPNLNCTDPLTTQLTGLVAGNGIFVMIGQHALAGSSFVLRGKVKFASGTATPLALQNGTIVGISEGQEHTATGTFKTVGSALPNCT